jgi:hypothetical protein
MNKATGVPAPLFLNKIWSDKKAIECAAILDAGHPTHAQRLWLVGFLKFAGYSMADVLDLIREHCEWRDYNEPSTSQSCFVKRAEAMSSRILKDSYVLTSTRRLHSCRSRTGAIFFSFFKIVPISPNFILIFCEDLRREVSF